MFGGKDMTKMMKQMGMDMDEIDADRVELTIGDKKIVFDNPSLSKIEAQGQEIFQLQGDYEEIEEASDEDIELVMEKTDASREEAKKALKDAGDVAEAVMELQ
jgi:nascent polypeptide-associated complex subunit alpha